MAGSSVRKRRRCRCLLPAVFSLALAAAASQAWAWSLNVTGDVGHPMALSESDLAAMPQETVSVVDEKGIRAEYRGVSVASVLEREQVPLGRKLRGSAMRLYVLARAADGYGVVYAISEFDPNYTSREILLALRRDGQPLSPREGPLRIVIPGDKAGARWVRNVMELKVGKAQ